MTTMFLKKKKQKTEEEKEGSEKRMYSGEKAGITVLEHCQERGESSSLNWTWKQEMLMGAEGGGSYWPTAS